MRIINNKKFLIAFLSVLLLSAVCFSGVTMMFADEENGSNNSDQVTVAKAAEPATNTPSSIIDWIIDFSNTTEEGIDPVYHIVEIYSGSGPSSLKDMTEGDNPVFENLVLNGHKSEGFTPNFNHGKIEYLAYSNEADDDELVAAIDHADLVYLSEDPQDLWDESNDISNKVSDALNKFALTDNKPLIIDSHNLTSNGLINNTNKYVKDIVSNYYAVEGASSPYNTFAWPHDKSLDFMNRAYATNPYRPISGKTQKDYWSNITYTEITSNANDPNTPQVDPPVKEVHDYAKNPEGKSVYDNDEYVGPGLIPFKYNEEDGSVVEEGDTNCTYLGPDRVARVLTIHNSAVSSGDSFLTDQMKACCTGDYDFTFTTLTDVADDPTTTTENKTVNAKGGFTADGTVLEIKDDGNALYSFGYSQRDDRPNAIKFESLDMNKAADITTLESLDYSQYDFVIFEATTKDVDISDNENLFKSLVGAMTSGVHVLYDSTMYSGSNNSSTISDLKAVNVRYIYEKVATSSDVSKYDSVLVTTREKMAVYSSATKPISVKDIADIIDAGTFRGISGYGSGDSSNIYTVLEIQPCYPIDPVLARALNSAKSLQPIIGHSYLEVADRGTFIDAQYSDSFYYLKTNGVLNKTDKEMTSDMISYGDNVPLTDLLESANAVSTIAGKISQDNINNVNDYYKWQLSKAKIAHATGKAYKDVRVVHMSSVEFAASRKSLLDSYDAIYIGGDYSAIKDADDWYAKEKGYNYYTMYFHDGDIYDYNNNLNMRMGGTYGALSGNDLTHSKMEELVQYAQKMPVILEDDLCDAYIEYLKHDQNQHLLDPDSNMRKFIQSITNCDDDYNLTAKYNNTVVNFDSGYTYKVVNEGNKYGKTYGGYATVFLGNETPDDNFGNSVKVDNNAIGETQLSKVLKTERPRIAVITKFDPYSDVDKTTWIDPDDIKNSGLEWKVQVSDSATVNVFIDDNSNGKFDDEELVDTKSGKNVTLSFKPDSDYYGVIYWKVEAIAKSGLSASTTGCCKIKRTTQSKMYVNLLNIMPIGEGCVRKKENGQSNTDFRNLYLCTECQFTKSKLYGNRYTTEGLFYKGLMSGANTFYNGAPSGKLSSTASVENNLKKFVPGYRYEGTVLGWHTHDFGIVNYNMNLGYDDVLVNLFDIIRDDYDVDTTILYTDEFDEKVDDVNDAFAGLSEANVKKKIEGSEGYNEKYNRYYNYYLAMQALINGKSEDGDVTYVTYEDGTCTVNFDLINSAFPATPSFTKAMNDHGITNEMLTNYAAASYKLDSIIKNTMPSVNSDKSSFDGVDHWQETLDSITNAKTMRDKRKYYDVYSCFNAYSRIPASYDRAYEDWRDAKIYENFFFEQYQDNLWYASYDFDSKTVDLDNVYDCIAIGAAEEFYKDDLESESCDALAKYIKADGNLILFHDALNSKSEATPTMSEKLSSLFGMNARHLKVATKKTSTSKNLNLIIGGTPYGNISIPANTQKREIVMEPDVESITADNNSVRFSAGDNLNSFISGLSNDDKEYDITIRKTQRNAGTFNVKLYTSDETWNKWNYNEVASLDFDASATSVEGELWFTWGNPTAGIHNFKTSGYNDGSHNISFKINVLREDGNNHSTSDMTYTKLYLVIGDDIANPIKLTDNSAYSLSSTKANGSTVKDVYTVVGTPSKKGSFGGGKGVQKFNFKFIDASDTPLSGEKINFIVNGAEGSAVSGDDGVAVVTRENYHVKAYNITEDKTEEIDTSKHPDGFIDDQEILITVKDVNGQGVEGKVVQANLSSSESVSAYTNEYGTAKFTFSNYVEEEDNSNRQYVVESSEYDENTYFMTNYKGTKNSGINLSPWMLSLKGKYIEFDVGNSAQKQQHLMYKYTSFYQKAEEVSNNESLIGAGNMMDTVRAGARAISMPTDRAEKNNEGIITLYPFSIPDQLHVGVTCPVSYAVDIEDPNIVVYYSLSGGTVGTSSSLFAADPMDGQNNYFLYQYGSITYTGAGHARITGNGRENNDERKLFINCIVNAGKKSARGPSVTLHDLDTTLDKVSAGKANETIRECSYEDCQYYTEIEDLEDFDGFDFLPHIPTSSKLDHVKVYYDVDHTDDRETNGVYTCDEDVDTLIFEWDRKENSDDTSVAENILTAMKKSTTDDKIVLLEDYFDEKTNRDYAYIVVQVESNNRLQSATLRIQYKQSLIDLN